MWEDSNKNALFHAIFFCRGSDTILGETSDPRELFEVYVCDDCPLGSIVRKAKVKIFITLFCEVFVFILIKFRLNIEHLIQGGQ